MITEMKRASKPLRIFIASLFATLILIFSAIGLITVDYRCRSETFGDKSPPFQVENVSEEEVVLHINTMGRNKTVDISAGAHIWELIKDFFCVS